MRIPTFLFARGTQRLVAVMLAAVLCGCATVSPSPQKSATANASAPLPGREIISGDDLRNGGRLNNDVALRSLSPIFH